MDPVKVSAMFAAYVWFTGHMDGAAQNQEQAVAFAREKWEEFLPSAHKGLGRLLIRLARMPKRGTRRRKQAVCSITG